ncbi:MAG TPA: hypothetical protein VE955_09305 [Candidatus Dormibacteraeota bacterium]|nr:hypothetical protein [Candidatus Dormibacteraeota bacterium]
MHPNWGAGRDKPTGNTKGVKKMKMRKIKGNKKGIDTILAALLMVVIVVVASVMVYAWSTGLLGTLLVTPQTGKEALNLEQAGFNSSTNATLSIRDSGSAAITLVTYYVKDSAGDQYARTSWTGPTMQPNGLGTAIVTIGATCGSSCTLTGTAFTFTSGNSYTVLVVTSRNNQFTFTITR